MQRPLWERKELKLPQERKKKRQQLKAKMQRRKGKNKFIFKPFTLIFLKLTCEFVSVEANDVLFK